MQDTQSKTLIIRFSSVGDIVLSSPLIRALQRRFPDGQIDFLVKDTYADLVRFSPYISHILPFPASGTFSDLRRLRTHIRSERYTSILDIHDSVRSRFLTFGLPGVRRIRKRKIARFVLVHGKRDIYAMFGGAPGIAERYLETAADLDIADDGAGLDIFLPPDSEETAARLSTELGIPSRGMVVGICPSARHFTKMWPAERFAEVTTAFIRRHEASAVFFGASEEEHRCRSIAAMVRRNIPEARIAMAAGRATLLDTAALMDKCAAVISNDTGLMHIAAARKRPLVAIFGSTTRQLGFFPVGTPNLVIENTSLSCRPCTHIGLGRCPLGHFRCMLDIEPSTVLAATERMTGRGVGSSPPNATT